MPVDSVSTLLQKIRRNAGLEENSGSLIETAVSHLAGDSDPQGREPLIESAGETYSRPISVCFAGVGTCGVNILMTFKEKNMDNNSLVDFVGINSDGDSINELERLGFDKNILLSHSDGSNSLGAGGDPEISKQMGSRHYEDFKKCFKNKDLVLVVTGMGGGTGTGAAPFVAKAAKEVQAEKRNTLTIGVTSLPAGYEADRYDLAMEGLEELRKYVDALVIIDQMNILDVLEEADASADQAEELVDTRFQVVLQSIMDTVTTYTKRNIDFADVCSTLKSCGDAIITTVEASSENIDNIKQELEKAVNDKLLVDHSKKVASRLLVYHFYEKGYSERMHYEVVGEVQKLFGWTKNDKGFYNCKIEKPSDDMVKFLKISGDSSTKYKGKNKVIVMAGGFEDAPPKPQIPPPATGRLEAQPVQQHIQQPATQYVPQPTQQIPQPAAQQYIPQPTQQIPQPAAQQYIPQQTQRIPQPVAQQIPQQGAATRAMPAVQHFPQPQYTPSPTQAHPIASQPLVEHWPLPNPTGKYGTPSSHTSSPAQILPTLPTSPTQTMPIAPTQIMTTAPTQIIPTPQKQSDSIADLLRGREIL